MANARSALAAVLLLVWMAAPALRCLLPGAALTSEEQACCKAMAGQCSESVAADHPCCKTARSTAQAALVSAQPAGLAVLPIADSVPVMVRPGLGQKFAADWLVDPSPPPRLEQTRPVLRI